MAVRNLRRPAEPEPTLHDYAAVRLVQLAEIIARGASEVFETRFGVKNTELRILVQLGDRASLSINELARRTHVDKAWISRSLRALQKRGFVQRMPHPTDTRASLVSLTPEGRDLVERFAPIARARHERLLAGLDKAEVYRMLDALLERAQDILANPDKDGADHG